MPNLNFTAKQAEKVQEATDAYNARTDESLSPKRWVYQLIRVGVESELTSAFADSEQANYQARIRSFKSQLAVEMEGNA